MKIKTHQDIIKVWPSLEQFAIDMGVKYHTAYAWQTRGIPSKYWYTLIKKAKKYGLELTAKILLDTNK